MNLWNSNPFGSSGKTTHSTGNTKTAAGLVPRAQRAKASVTSPAPLGALNARGTRCASCAGRK